MRLIIQLFLIIALSFSLTYAQSEVMDRGESGFSLLVGTSERDGESVDQGGVALSFLSQFDIGFFYASLPTSDNATVIFGQFHLHREYMLNGQLPFNIAVFGQFTNIESQTSRTIGVSVYKRYGQSINALIIPAFSLSTTSYEGGRDNLDAIGLALTFGGRASKVAIFHLTPSLTIIEDEDILGATVGVTFAFGGKEIK